MYNIVNEDDFKYIMQDVSRYYFGGRLSYKEIIDDEMAPFKFKTILERYILRDIDESSALESHLYHLDNNSPEWRVFKQLKAKVRVTQYKKGTTDRYTESVYTMDQLSSFSLEEKEEKGFIIRELILSKLGLLMFSV